MKTSKILDNTVISAFLKEIPSVDLFEKCNSEFHLITSEKVHSEASKFFSKDKIAYSHVKVVKVKTRKAKRLLEYLKNRFPYLHEGELTSFVVCLYKYKLQNKKYFYVTDDLRMKKVISQIFSESDLKKYYDKTMGSVDDSFNFTGTIGLIIRLCEKGRISDLEILKIINDLRSSTFYVSEKLLKRLRRCNHEIKGAS